MAIPNAHRIDASGLGPRGGKPRPGQLKQRAFWLRPDGTWQRDPYATQMLSDGRHINEHPNIQVLDGIILQVCSSCDQWYRRAQETFHRHPNQVLGTRPECNNCYQSKTAGLLPPVLPAPPHEQHAAREAQRASLKRATPHEIYVIRYRPKYCPCCGEADPPHIQFKLGRGNGEGRPTSFYTGMPVPMEIVIRTDVGRGAYARIEGEFHDALAAYRCSELRGEEIFRTPKPVYRKIVRMVRALTPNSSIRAI